MKDLSAIPSILSRVSLVLALLMLSGGPSAASAQTKQATAQDMFFEWAKNSGLTFAGQKGNMYMFILKTGDNRDRLLTCAKFINGNWVEGSTAYPVEGVRPQYTKLLRDSHTIHYWCAMASQGRFTEAYPKADIFATKLFKGEITSFDAIRIAKKTYRDNSGEMVAQTDFFLK